MKVITWQSPSGATVNLTPRQGRLLGDANAWPRDHRGQEFCTVSHGLHTGEPTYSDDQIIALLAHALF